MKKIIIVLCAIAAMLLLANCASGPPYREVVVGFGQPQTNQGRIYFYRPSAVGAAIRPDVRLNDEVVGAAISKGFFYVDRDPGKYEVTTSTELEKKATFTLDSGQTRYIKLNIAIGIMVGRVYPELVDEKTGKEEIEGTKYIGGSAASNQ